MIPYARQNINSNDIRSVVKVLKSDFLTTGPMVPKFEAKLAKKVKANHGVAVNSATSALHIACLALGLKKNDYLWTVPLSFVASANCGLYCGAKIEFVDIEKNFPNIDVNELEKKLIKSKKKKTLPKILVVVDFCGHSCDMKKISELSKIYRFKVIEDASHALGGTYMSNPVGSCKYSDITVFSFHPIKMITTAEGGMALTNNKTLYEKLILLRSHGITRNSKFFKNKKKHQQKWYYEQLDLGFNYRMNDIQAALGLSQLNRLNFFVKKRNYIAKFYNKNLKDLPISLPKVRKNTLSSFHLYIIQINKKIKKGRDEVFKGLLKLGIGVNVHYIPIHLQPFFKSKGFKLGQFKNSENFFKQSITIPLHCGLTNFQLNRIIYSIKKCLKN